MATEADKTSNAVLATVVVVGALAMITVSALLAAVSRSAQRELDERRPVHADLSSVAKLKANQRQALVREAGWASVEKKRVHFPLPEAKRTVLAEYKRDPAAASPPAPAGLATPAGAEGAPVE